MDVTPDRHPGMTREGGTAFVESAFRLCKLKFYAPVGDVIAVSRENAKEWDEDDRQCNNRNAECSSQIPMILRLKERHW